MSNRWTTANIPDLTGQVAVVTGANSGIGCETAKALVAKGAAVVMACRSMEKARQAADRICQDIAGADLTIIQLDLADLASVRSFAKTFFAQYDRLDLLINNAGIMAPPFTQTKDGFELQFGVNHLGHFALTGLLLDRLLATPQARIVSVSSYGHRFAGTIHFDNLGAELGYQPMSAYAQSKLANLLFILELNRQLAAHGSEAVATAAHPGWTLTGLPKGFLLAITRLIGQRPPMGALPILRAATDPAAQRDDYYGPGGLMEIRGFPRKVRASAAAQDAALAERLWQVSEEMTGIQYQWPR